MTLIIPDILFLLHRDMHSMEESKAILDTANLWMAENPKSDFFPAVLAAYKRYVRQATNTFLSNKKPIKVLFNVRVPVTGDEPTEGWCPE